MASVEIQPHWRGRYAQGTLGWISTITAERISELAPYILKYYHHDGERRSSAKTNIITLCDEQCHPHLIFGTIRKSNIDNDIVL